jgi:hypothetical protein
MDDTQRNGTLPNFRGSLAKVPSSYPTSESLLPHPTNVFNVKHSRLAFRTFPVQMKGFSFLSGHLGNGGKVPCLRRFHITPNPKIPFRGSTYRKSSSALLRLFSPPFLGKYSNHESVPIAEICKESAVDRGTCAGFRKPSEP